MCLLSQGNTIKQTAQVVNIHPRTVYKWVNWYKRGGVEEIRKHRPGRIRLYKKDNHHTDDRSNTDNSQTINNPVSPELIQDSDKHQQTFHFVNGESVEEGVKRMICEKIDYTIWQLTESPYGQEKAVHEARKSCKKIRAVLRLVRDEIGIDIYRRENICYRDASRLLAPVRDSAVLVETLDRLVHRFEEQLVPGSFASVRKNLVEQQQAICKSILNDNNAIEIVIDVLEQARRRTLGLPISNNDYSAMRDGLRRVYRRGRRRLSNAYCDPDVEIFHDWRKRIKYLWNQCRIFELIWPGYLGMFAGRLKEISDCLGDDHDLSELRIALSDKPHWFTSPGERQVLFALTEYWNQELRVSARPSGVRIYVESPGAFTKRIGHYWNIWHEESLKIESRSATKQA